ncbi:putative quinol monooxygenase [Arenibacterium sp. CAU 1754]
MIIVSGTMEVEPEGVDAMKDAAAIMAVETRAETGCIVYAFWQNIETPTEFRVYEEWEDMDCLKAHAKSAHMAAYREKLKNIGILGRDINLFEPGPMTKI